MARQSPGSDTVPNQNEADVVQIGNQRISRRFFFIIAGLVSACVLGTATHLVFDFTRFRRNKENNENQLLQSKIIAYFDENDDRIEDPAKGMPGNSFSFLVTERLAPDVSIIDVETTVGNFKGEIPDDRDHPGKPGWPIVSHDNTPAYVIGNQRFYLIKVNMNDVDDNAARNPNQPNMIPYGDTFNLSVNTTVEYHGRKIILYETPGEIPLKRQPQK